MLREEGFRSPPPPPTPFSWGLDARGLKQHRAEGPGMWLTRWPWSVQPLPGLGTRIP